MPQTATHEKIENGAQAIAALRAVLEFIEREDRKGLDPVESIRVIHLAASVAASESTC